ncbi:MAG: choice-of-anchor Q domain-containing protein [Pirellulales bacterium]
MTPILGKARSCRAVHTSPRGRRKRLRGFERLEDRALLAAFTVNSLLDTVDANPGDGMAMDAAGQTTLRAAIMEANARAGDDSIILSTGDYKLTLGGANEDGAVTGDLDVAPNGRLIITGNGAATTFIDAAGLGDRIFHVLAFANLNISGVTVRNGNVTSAPVGQTGDGGGFLNAGMLSINSAVISANSARDFGGGVANAANGTLTITNSTIAANLAPAAAGIYIASGNATLGSSTVSGNAAVSDAGGIFNVNGTLTVVNSTVSANVAQGNGGGITNSGELTIRNSTIADNTAGMSGGGVYNTGSGSVAAQNTIFADNEALGGGSPDFSGAANSLGDNLIGNTTGSSGWIASDLQNVDPRLGPLANNGGPTQTHALLAGSPAIDAGESTGAPATDQRGAPFIRIFNGTVDIGAYERQAFSFIVDTAADENDGKYAAGDLSLREAIFLTNSNPGRDTITGGGTLSLGELLITSDLSMRDMGLNGSNMSRVLHIAAGISVDIAATTIRNGLAAEGGAIRNDGVLTIVDSTISENTATIGGGLLNNGTLTITRSTVSNNDATDGTNGRGGGIANFGQLTIQNSTITENTAASLGGGIYNAEAATLSLIDSTIATNSATGFVLGIRGGGIYNLGTATITRSTVSGNIASPEGSSGGGIYNQAGMLAVTNSTISGNSANQTGGIFNNAQLTIKHSTITGNSTNMFVGPPSEGSGGIANARSGSVSVQNTIIAGNIAGTVGGTPDYFGTANSLGHNVIGNTAGSSGWLASDLQNVDPRLSPLADNGGPTRTHALLAGSPAIDAGNNESAPPTDQRGEPFERIANGTIDIGAYETQPLRFIVDITHDENDGNYATGDLSLREAILLTSDNPDHDIIEFAPALASSTITLTMGELPITSDLTITGLGIDQLTISGNDASRVFHVAAGATVAVSELTIRNGRALEGGGILNFGTLTLNLASVSDNSGPGNFGPNPKGGGIYNAGRLTITDSTISNNARSGGPGGAGEGGGIWNSGVLTIRDSTISNNSIVGFGAGIYNTVEGTATIVRCTISENVQQFLGSGGAIWSAGDLSIQHSTISGNRSESRGAITNTGDLTVQNTVISGNFGSGIWNEGDLTVQDSTISRNFGTAVTSGSGIYNSASGAATILRTMISENASAVFGGGGGGINNLGTLSVIDSTISANTAPTGSYLSGGGIYSQSGTVTITNSTISGNSAYAGGGIYNNGTMTLRSSTVAHNFTVRGAGNTSSRPGGVANSESGSLTVQNTIIAGNRLGFGFGALTAPDVLGVFNSIGNNLIGDATGSSGWTVSDQTGSATNPLDPRVGPLGDNGGPTMTHALLDGSPAIDAGNNSAAPTADQRGVARPKDGNGDGTATVDIGAFELARAGEVPDIQGSSGDDTFLVRRSGTEVQVFTNDAGTGMPIFATPIDSITSLVINAGIGDDRLIVDLVNGVPIPSGSIHFVGSQDDEGDSLIIRGDMNTAEYLPSRTVFSGVVIIGGGEIFLREVESIDVSHFESFQMVTPNSRDELFLQSLGAGEARLSGMSSLQLEELTFSDVATFIIDAATNDAFGLGDDSLTVFEAGVVPDETGFVQFLSGVGTNSVTVRNATARVDASVDVGGTLNTTLSDGAQLVTHRLRQSSLTVGAGSRATILPDGTDAATSVLNSLTINTGGTLDINDNALIVDYTGNSPVATIRQRIVSGRGGVGVGQGTWTGTGITSGTAQQANATEPDARSVGYAENATLPLGRYTTFRGQPVDDTAVLIAYTRTADANLDGLVNDDDATIVGATYGPGVAQPHWALGDFDYNDFVDDDDVTLLGVFYNPSAAPLTMPPMNTAASALNDGNPREGALLEFFSALGAEQGEEEDRLQKRRVRHRDRA